MKYFKERYERKVKKKNDNYILSLGGRVCDHLPLFGFQEKRPAEEIGKRVLCMYALCCISDGAPIGEIKSWLEKNHLIGHLSPDELRILSFTNEELPQQDMINLNWYIEGIWTGLWALGLIEELDELELADVPHMLNYMPVIWEGETTEKFLSEIKGRTSKEVYEQADLYYRLHWLVVDERLRNGSIYTGEVGLDNDKVLSGSLVVERRRLLTWIMTSDDWDEVDMNT